MENELFAFNRKKMKAKKQVPAKEFGDGIMAIVFSTVKDLSNL